MKEPAGTRWLSTRAKMKCHMGDYKVQTLLNWCSAASAASAPPAMLLWKAGSPTLSNIGSPGCHDLSICSMRRVQRKTQQLLSRWIRL